ncbi:MAG: hypothetical protein QXZ22_02435 [Sulfolobales archaeon]
MKYDSRLRALDELLREVGKYCHPDAPIEYIVISRNAFLHRNYKSEIMKKLYDPSKAGVKVSLKLEVNGREVELVKDPVLSGRLEVVVKRRPRNDTLTFKEVVSILQSIEALLEEKVDWGYPFPRGSC